MRLGRLRLILLSLTLLLLVGGVAVVVTGAQSERSRLRENRLLLNEKINERSRTLRELQSEWIDDRDDVFAAFQAINEILSVARSPAGVGQAQTRWPTVQKLMDTARRASSRMPNLTGRAVLEATLARAEIDELRSITGDDEPLLRRLAALDHAVALLVETDRVYSKINRRITNAMPAYEDLVGVTDAFLRDHRQGRFGNNEVASDFYALQTQRFVQPINQIRADLRALDEEAAQAASLTVEAFEEWNRLRRAD